MKLKFLIIITIFLASGCMKYNPNVATADYYQERATEAESLAFLVMSMEYKNVKSKSGHDVNKDNAQYTLRVVNTEMSSIIKKVHEQLTIKGFDSKIVINTGNKFIDDYKLLEKDYDVVTVVSFDNTSEDYSGHTVTIELISFNTELDKEIFSFKVTDTLNGAYNNQLTVNAIINNLIEKKIIKLKSNNRTSQQ